MSRNLNVTITNTGKETEVKRVAQGHTEHLQTELRTEFRRPGLLSCNTKQEIISLSCVCKCILPLQTRG